MRPVLQLLRQRARWQWYRARFAVGLGRGLLLPRAGRRLLVYHGVDRSGRTDVNSRFTSVSSLACHLEWLARHSRVVTVEEYFRGAPASDRLTVALSFDDGYANFLYRALPLLEKYELPATVYVTASPSLGYPILWCDLFDLLRFLAPELLRGWAGRSGRPRELRRLQHSIRAAGPPAITRFLDDCIPAARFMGDPAWDDHWRLLSAEDLARLAEHPLITIGSHTVLHPDLSLMPLAEALTECRAAKDWLESSTRRSVADFALPFGAASLPLVEGLHGLGFERLVFNGAAGGAAEVGGEERLGVNPHLADAVQLVEILRGSYV